MKKDKPKEPERWQETLTKLFTDIGIIYSLNWEDGRKIKDFIRTLLSQQRQELLKEIIGKLTIIEKIKSFIGKIGWILFLWANNMTAEEYWEIIFEQEKLYRINSLKGHPKK